MTARYSRVRSAVHRTAHLRAPGAGKALCGALPPRGGKWLDGGNLKDCRACANAARTAEAVAAWDGPALRPGILAVVTLAHGARCAVGGCAECERVRPLRARGLCEGCYSAARDNGTVEGYGWTTGERMAEFAGCRGGGLSIGQASERAGVSRRTGHRYEAALAGAGKAPWRAGMTPPRPVRRDLREAS